MFRTIMAALVGLVSLISSAYADPPNAKISALASGVLLLNGKAADLASIEAEFKRLQTNNGEVWYYRDNPHAEPTPQAMAVVKLVIQYRLPISFSTKPDFSDAVDDKGRSAAQESALK